ncbi:MAG: hypothetical protein K2P14_10885 [Anaeroplasmataceae bacterium]|nr:hypothetical protein [Anaeroplasmataceae bacterium]
MKTVIKRVKLSFSNKFVSQNIALILISLIITCSMSTTINSKVDKMLGSEMKNVNIRFSSEKNNNSTGYSIYILNNSTNTPRDAYDYIIQSLELSNIEYTVLENWYKNSQDAIMIDSNANTDKQLIFQCPFYSNTSIDFVSSAEGGILKVDCGKFSQEYDLYNENVSTIIRCTPLCESYRQVILFFIVYILVFLLSVTLVYLLNDCVLKKILSFCNRNASNKFIKYNIKIDTPIIFLSLSTFFLAQYFGGFVPHYLKGGDQNTYWNLISSLTDIDALKSIPDHRGYLCYLLPALCKTLETYLGINAVALWIVFLNLLAAILLGIVLPMLSKKVFNTEITRLQVYFSIIIMCILLRGQLLYVLMDFPAAALFFAGMTCYIYFVEKPSVLNGLFCGISFSAAINFRSPYKITVLGTIVVLTIYLIVEKKKAGQALFKKMLNKKNIMCTAMLIFGFILICVPQLLINSSKGVVSLFPFTRDGAYYGTDAYHSLPELSASGSFDNMRMYPARSKADGQVQHIKTDYIGDISTVLNFQQLFEMFLRKPIDTLIYIMKKLYLGFNSLNPYVYPGGTYKGYQDSIVWLNCLLNYIVFFSGIYAVFKLSKHIKEKIVFFIIAGFAILPLTIEHVEWRYYLSGYILANFLFCYHFLPETSKWNMDIREKAKNYYGGLTFFLLTTIIICATIT